MDRADSDERMLFRTLAQFRYINYLSRSRTLINALLIRDMLERDIREPRIVDFGSGAGDLALWMASACRRRGVSPRIFCIDHDPRVIRFARKACAGEEAVTVIEGSFEDIHRRVGAVDYLFSNHLLHHLPPLDLPSIVSDIHRISRRGFLLNDLTRSHYAFLLYTLLAGVAFRRSFAFYDGRLSIRRAYTVAEIRQQLGGLDLDPEIRIGRILPARLYVWCLKG